MNEKKLSTVDQLFEEGNQLFRDGLFAKAMEKYGEVVRQNPNHLRAYVNRGVARTYIPDYERAITDYTKAIGLWQKSDSENASELAMIFMNRGHAYSNLDSPEAQSENDEEKKAAIDRNSKNLQKALSDYNQAIELNSEFAEAYCNRAIIYHRQKKMELAILDYKRSADISPNSEAGIVAERILGELGNPDLS